MGSLIIDEMKFYSTNRQSPVVDFREAAIAGQPSDKGLYFPSEIPMISKDLLSNIEDISNEDIAYEVIRPYVAGLIPEDILFNIVAETINFPIPLVRLSDSISVLELFHGPTLAFKDIGARFMSRCLGYFVKDDKRKLTVLVATSGDTGGAVANGFYEVEGIDVIILYPAGKVSSVQELQLTTMGKNITALEVTGSFDDCQRMVKAAFVDATIQENLFLTSANSINVARWLPQQFYYFFAYKQWQEKSRPPVISVPSGNFGNICAGILAMSSGLPVQHFIAACNENDIVSHYLETKEWQPRLAVPTLSNAMDVGDPSNFIRILEIFHHQFNHLKEKLSAYTISDRVTLETIREVYQQFNYMLDPHGAVGYKSLENYVHDNKIEGLFLETAHPVKFPDAIKKSIGINVPIPPAIEQLSQLKKHSMQIKPEFSALKEYLLNK